MSLLVPLGALALLAIPAIVLLYFLKVKRPEVKVATLMFWRPYMADRQANAPWQRLRFSLLLLVQLLAALALAVGLMRPGLTGAAGVAPTTLGMIDASPRIEATSGPRAPGGGLAHLPAGRVYGRERGRRLDQSAQAGFDLLRAGELRTGGSRPEGGDASGRPAGRRDPRSPGRQHHRGLHLGPAAGGHPGARSAPGAGGRPSARRPCLVGDGRA